MNCLAKFLAGRMASFGHALRGLRDAIRTQANARVHLLATALVVALGFGLRISALEWALVIGAIALVWLAELLNTAVEILCDIIEPAYSEKVKRAKDVAAAAVLAAAIGAAIIGGIVFVPYFTG